MEGHYKTKSLKLTELLMHSITYWRFGWDKHSDLTVIRILNKQKICRDFVVKTLQQVTALKGISHIVLNDVQLRLLIRSVSWEQWNYEYCTRKWVWCLFWNVEFRSKCSSNCFIYCRSENRTVTTHFSKTSTLLTGSSGFSLSQQLILLIIISVLCLISQPELILTLETFPNCHTH